MYIKRKCKDKANIGAGQEVGMGLGTGAGMGAEWVRAIMAASFDWCRVVTGPWGASSACLSTLREPWTVDTGQFTLFSAVGKGELEK